MKKSVRTKWVSFMLATVLLTSLLTACGNSTPAPASSTPSSTTSSTPEATPSGEPSTKLVDKETTLTVLMPEHASYPVKSYNESPFLKHITEVTNVKLDLQVVPDAGDAYKQKLNIMLNGNTLPDVIWSSSNDVNINSLAVKGMFVPYSDHLDTTPNIKKVLNDIPSITKNLAAEDGKLYIMPRLTLNTMTELFMIREDLMTAENLAQPKNYEDLYQILKTLKDKNPDKKVFINRNGTEHVVNRLAYSWGSGYETSTHGFYLDRDTDKYAYGPADESFKNMILWLKKLYDEKILDADYSLMDTKQWEEAFSNENALFAIDFIARIQTVNNVYINNKSAARVVAINPPAGESGKKGIMGRLPVMSNSGIIISSSSKNIDTALKFVDWIYSDTGRYIATYGIEGETFTVDTEGRPSWTEQMKRQAKPDGKELVKDFGWVYYLNKYEFPVGYEKALAADPVPVDDRMMFSRSVMEDNNAVIDPDPVLVYTDNQLKVLKSNGTDISDYFKQNIDKFIMGTRPMSEWDAFINEIKQLGVSELEAVLNEAYQAYKSK